MRACACLAVLLLATPARAALIRVDFAGAIDLVYPSDSPAIEGIGDSLHIGTPFAGYFVFDDAIEAYPVSVLPFESNFFYQLPVQGGADHHVTIGDYEMGIGALDNFDFPVGFSARVHWSPYTNGYLTLRNEAPLVISGPAADAFSFLRIELNALWGTIPESGALDALSWNRGDYQAASWATFGFRGPTGAVDYRGTISSLSATPVPEPGLPFLLVPLGAAALAGLGFRRARS